MHCPRCGQLQVSSETKFCSRCGFQLAIVAELLVNGGALPQLAAIQQKKTIFNKKNGVIFSAVWFIFFTMFLTSVWGILDVEELAGLCAVTGLFGSLCILIASLALLPSSKLGKSFPVYDNQGMGPVPVPAPATLHGHQNLGSLPAHSQQPAEVYSAPHGSWRVPETGDLVERGSVIEGTTKLLKKEEKQ